MNISSLFNRMLNRRLWHLCRTLYYDFRHQANSIRLPKGKRYYALEHKINKLSPNDAIAMMRAHFSNVEHTLSCQGRLKVGFCVYSSSEWQCEKIYRYMEADRRFEPSIILCGLHTSNYELTKRTYEETCRFFERKGRYSLDYFGCEKHNQQEPKLDDYDILFYFQPSSNYLPESINFAYRLQKQLMAFVLYGYKQICDKDIHTRRNYEGVDLLQMFWVYFCVNKSEYEIRSRLRLKGYNSVISGFPKIDDLLECTFVVRDNLWKSIDSKPRHKIIWAPHFNMQNNMNGTFHENYRWFYEFAKNNPQYSWIVRPHPRMLTGVLQKGVFDSVEAYDEYIANWNTLPNARVIPYGDYYDFFATSDAMITDCMSFVPEYLYTKKPLLLLLPAQPRMVNDEAKKIRDHACYHARGNDQDRIRIFIEHDIDEDHLRVSRDTVFNEILDTRSKLGMSASEYIYNWICRLMR